MNCIDIVKLNKWIKDKHILCDIDLSISKGASIGFVGANGSGKTMLLRAIAGLLHLDSGSIIYHRPMTKGVIIENPAFLNDLTGFDNLRYLASFRGIISDAHIRQVMENVLLDPDDRRKVKTYSLGMKQKLAIAQAIMESPELLILDEPTRGLDEESVLCVRALLHTLKDSGVTILLSSHNKEDILSICDQVLTIDNGALVS